MHVVPSNPYPPRCRCRCNNHMLRCFNLTRYNTRTCQCECPWFYIYFGNKLCPENKFFDPITCSCICKEPCKDCTEPQLWNPNTCKCDCGRIAPCKYPKYWNEWTCRCECQQAPRRCCPEMNKRWDPNVRLHS